MAGKWDRLDVDGSLADLDFIAKYFDGGRLVAAAAIGRGGDPGLDADSELRRIADEIGRSRARLPE